MSLLSRPLVHGIDVSAWQSQHPDLTGSSFCFVKATEGIGYLNPKYRTQVAWAREHGLVVGHYLFAIPGRDTMSQVQWFRRWAAIADGDLIVLDWEKSGVTQADRDLFLRLLMAAFPLNKVGLYCNLNFWKHIDTESNAGDFLWIADPNNPAGHPAIQHPWVFHQYGIANNVDQNVANFHTIDQLRAWAFEKHHQTPPPAATQHTLTTPPKENPVTEMTPETPATVPTPVTNPDTGETTTVNVPVPPTAPTVAEVPITVPVADLPQVPAADPTQPSTADAASTETPVGDGSASAASSAPATVESPVPAPAASAPTAEVPVPSSPEPAPSQAETPATAPEPITEPGPVEQAPSVSGEEPAVIAPGVVDHNPAPTLVEQVVAEVEKVAEEVLAYEGRAGRVIAGLRMVHQTLTSEPLATAITDAIGYIIDVVKPIEHTA